MSIIKSETDPLALAMAARLLTTYPRIPPKHDPKRLLHPPTPTSAILLRRVHYGSGDMPGTQSVGYVSTLRASVSARLPHGRQDHGSGRNMG
jgi:hypothetical protein